MGWLSETKAQVESFIKTMYQSYKAFVEFLNELLDSGKVTLDVVQKAQSLYVEFKTWCKNTFAWAK
tara:strand:+ start:2694 stop:2891 length:198 start_codon:yes stop_codon:yes gene_type:complete